MLEKLDKRDRASLFRERLSRALQNTGMSQTRLAARIGVNRSTISQLLGADDARLPNAQVVAECAATLGVSADWLLGLSQRPEQAADLVAASATLTQAQRALIDDQILTWHQEAAGYKIRHVPATLPDMLKTKETLEWEYGPQLGRSSKWAIQKSEERLALMQQGQSDFEIAIPVEELRTFAYAEGYYRGIPADIRKAQLEWIRDLHYDAYPSLRMHLFDQRRFFSAPLTVFGPLLAVMYMGSHYLAFRDTERIRVFTQHFDTLVREASIIDRDVPAFLDDLIDSAGLDTD